MSDFLGTFSCRCVDQTYRQVKDTGAGGALLGLLTLVYSPSSTTSQYTGPIWVCHRPWICTEQKAGTWPHAPPFHSCLRTGNLKIETFRLNSPCCIACKLPSAATHGGCVAKAELSPIWGLRYNIQLVMSRGREHSAQECITSTFIVRRECISIFGSDVYSDPLI